METLVKDLKPGLKNLQMTVIVLDVGKPSTTKENHVIRTVRLADGSGSVNMSVWNEPGEYVKPGDICKLNRVYTAVFKGCLTLYTGKVGEIIKIGEFCMQFSELPFISEFNPQYTNEGVKAAAHAKGQVQQFSGNSQQGHPAFRPDGTQVSGSVAPNGRPQQPGSRPQQTNPRPPHVGGKPNAQALRPSNGNLPQRPAQARRN